MEPRELAPVVILIVPRFSSVTMAAANVLTRYSSPKFAVAFYGSEDERRSYYRDWGESETPLLLLRAGSPPAADVATDIAGRYPSQPVAILVADGPEVPNFKDCGEALCRDLANAACAALTDVQIFLYSATWATRPPRIR